MIAPLGTMDAASASTPIPMTWKTATSDGTPRVDAIHGAQKNRPTNSAVPLVSATVTPVGANRRMSAGWLITPAYTPRSSAVISTPTNARAAP